MSLIDDLNSLDFNDVGRWPLPFRIGAIVLVFLAVLAAGVYMTIINDKKITLERVEQKEQELRTTFEDRQNKAANFQLYADQLIEMEQTFGSMLRQLPGETEIPNLITDISQTGLAAGLEEKLFQPQNEIQRDFYAEKPIQIRLTGSYHAFANFASSVAALPRIVTLHDVTIKPDQNNPNNLTLDVTAKTYRYLEEDEG